MWQAFTERTRRCIFNAQEVAADFDQRIVTPEHLYLGLLREDNSNAADLLKKNGVDRIALANVIEAQCVKGTWDRKTGDMELSDTAKHVIDVAYAVARDAAVERGERICVGTEHLLAALIEHTGIGAMPTEEALPQGHVKCDKCGRVGSEDEWREAGCDPVDVLL